MEIEYSQMKDYFSRNCFSRRQRQYNKLFNRIEEIVDIQDIKEVYPKNFPLEDKPIEFYVFSNDKIMMCIITDESLIEIQLFNTKDINNIKYSVPVNDNNDCSKLIITFISNDSIVLNSSIDTNDDWSWDFKHQITKITKFLTDFK
jgi:hypothetical protein